MLNNTVYQSFKIIHLVVFHGEKRDNIIQQSKTKSSNEVNLINLTRKPPLKLSDVVSKLSFIILQCCLMAYKKNPINFVSLCAHGLRQRVYSTFVTL